MKKQALGRGLSALIETEPVAAVGSTLFNEIEISKINPNPNSKSVIIKEDRHCIGSSDLFNLKSYSLIEPIKTKQEPPRINI